MTTGDTLVFLVGKNPKLAALLERLGYRVVQHRGESPFPGQDLPAVIDGIVIDEQSEAGGQPLDRLEICDFLRNTAVTRGAPIVLQAATAEEQAAIQTRQWSDIELVPAGTGAGVLVAKIATALRLRKMAGADEAQASLAAANAALRDLNTRFAREREEARKIQESLLPRDLPKDPRIELACSYQPLDEVGGDWFCVQREQNDQLTIQIADVTGHGLAAAFIGSMTKLALSASPQILPHERLAEMNRLMTPQLPEGRFVTIAAALYDLNTGVFHFARGGHPPALVYRCQQGTVEELGGKGYAFGFFDTGIYTTEQVTLEPGDLALFYTDGISEAQNRNMEQFGVTRMREALGNSARAPNVGLVLEALYQKLVEFCDGRVLKDDVTLIALRRAQSI